MTDDTTPPPEDAPSQAEPSTPDTLDFSTLFASAKDYLLKPLSVVEDIKAMASNSAEYFSSKKDGGLNASLGFFLVVCAALLIFNALGAIFTTVLS